MSNVSESSKGKSSKCKIWNWKYERRYTKGKNKWKDHLNNKEMEMNRTVHSLPFKGFITYPKWPVINQTILYWDSKRFAILGDLYNS